MNCPFCGHYDSRVIDSRDINDGIRRRRECLKCRARFTTHERLQAGGLFVIKKDQRREEFNRDKLLAGLRRACEKRPLPSGIVDKMADDIEAELYRQGRTEVSSSVIGDLVMQRLKTLDHIAYIRFASVYREFEDITALKQEVDSLVGVELPERQPENQLPLIPDDELDEADKSRLKNRLRAR